MDLLISLGITVLAILGPSACLGIVLWRMARYARPLGKSTNVYTAVSIVGWLLGLVGSAVVIGLGMDALKGSNRNSELRAWAVIVVAYVVVLAGATVGAATGYIWLRMAARRDPDYDDLPVGLPKTS